MSGTTTRKLCCLSIGLETFIMNAADGMKVAALLQGAKPATREYAGSGEFTYRTEAMDAEVTWTSVRADQVSALQGDKPPRRRRGAASTVEAP